MSPRVVPVLAFLVTMLGVREVVLRRSEARQAESLLACGEGEIDRLDVRVRGRAVRLVRAAGAWRRSEGERLAAPAASAVESLVGSLCSLPVLDRLGGAADPALGLDPPGIELALGTATGEHEVALGARSPVGSLVYARLERQPGALLVGSLLADQVERVVAAVDPR